jgi:hypothetical protein
VHPSQTGQRAVAVYGQYANQHGTVSKHCGQKCTVEWDSGASSSVDRQHLHQLLPVTTTAVAAAPSAPAPAVAEEHTNGQVRWLSRACACLSGWGGGDAHHLRIRHDSGLSCECSYMFQPARMLPCRCIPYGCCRTS